jgi:hypothetical protein
MYTHTDTRQQDLLNSNIAQMHGGRRKKKKKQRFEWDPLSLSLSLSLCVDHQMGSFGGKLQAILNFTADSYILRGVSSEISPFVVGN